MASHCVMKDCRLSVLSFSVNFAEVCVQVSVGASEALHCPDSSNREVA